MCTAADKLAVQISHAAVAVVQPVTDAAGAAEVGVLPRARGGRGQVGVACQAVGWAAGEQDGIVLVHAFVKHGQGVGGNDFACATITWLTGQVAVGAAYCSHDAFQAERTRSGRSLNVPSFKMI